MRRLRRFFALAPDERRRLLEASFLLTLVQLGLGRMPFTMLRRLVTRSRRRDRRMATSDRAVADQIVWAVTAASRRVPGPSTCLSRALTVQAMLAREGYPSQLHVGVARGQQGAVEGHAWVESAGRILIGGTASEIEGFTRLAALDVNNPFTVHGVETVQGAR